MTRKNASSIDAAKRRMRLMFVAQFSWLGLVCLLGGWWGRLVMRQAARIAELEQAAGHTAIAVRDEWMHTHRMLFWESSTFFVLLLASTGLLFWLYWRDMLRARSLQAFFASVTHELRTPLTSIRLQAESIADAFSESASERKLVSRLLEDTMRLEGQVERTLELARVEGGGVLFLQPLQIKPWLDRLLQLWKQTYGPRVKFNVRVDDLTIVADPTALGVILKNLMENAIRHAKKDEIRVDLSVESKGGAVFLTFKDDGKGYAGDLKYLGEVFHRGPGSEGSGVGLYLIRVLMRQMGGLATFDGQSGFQVALKFREGREGRANG